MSEGGWLADFNLASLAYSAEGTPRDHAAAYRLARAGAGRGNLQASLMVGTLLFRGDGVALNKREAVAWYRKAADLGSVEAARAIGWEYLTGINVPRDPALGEQYLERAAQAGDPRAQLLLGGHLFDRKQTGDSIAATTWVQKAAARHYAPAYAALRPIGAWRSTGSRAAHKRTSRSRN